jgi:hypothetical protein
MAGEPLRNAAFPITIRLMSGLIGKRILIGITYLDHDDKVLRQEQLHGVILAADEGSPIRIGLKGSRDGEEFSLPPDLSALEDAPPGEYRLRGSGEVVVDPDLLTTWTVQKPRPS